MVCNLQNSKPELTGYDDHIVIIVCDFVNSTLDSCSVCLEMLMFYSLSLLTRWCGLCFVCTKYSFILLKACILLIS